MKVFLLTVALLLLAVVLLGVKVLFIKGSSFPTGHAHDLPALKEKGIGCAHGKDNK